MSARDTVHQLEEPRDGVLLLEELLDDPRTDPTPDHWTVRLGAGVAVALTLCIAVWGNFGGGALVAIEMLTKHDPVVIPQDAKPEPPAPAIGLADAVGGGLP